MELVANRAIATNTQVISQDFYSRFLQYLDVKPRTAETYTRTLKPFFMFINEHNITRPTFLDILDYKKGLKASGKSDTTIYAYIFIVRKFFEWTSDEGLYPNVAGKIKGDRISPEPRKEALKDFQAHDVIYGIDDTTLKGKRDKAIVALMITCGLRDIEVIRANIEDLDSDSGQPRLFVQGKKHETKDDYVNVDIKVLHLIKEYLTARGASDPNEPLFTSTSNNNHNGRLTVCTISTICKDSMRNVGIDSPRYTAHSFRHTAVTLALRNNNRDLQATQQFARHRKMDTTLIYAHNLDKADNNCSSLVANCIL